MKMEEARHMILQKLKWHNVTSFSVKENNWTIHRPFTHRSPTIHPPCAERHCGSVFFRHKRLTAKLNEAELHLPDRHGNCWSFIRAWIGLRPLFIKSPYLMIKYQMLPIVNAIRPTCMILWHDACCKFQIGHQLWWWNSNGSSFFDG